MTWTPDDSYWTARMEDTVRSNVEEALKPYFELRRQLRELLIAAIIEGRLENDVSSEVIADRIILDKLP